MTNKTIFPWGLVREVFVLDLDGKTIEITKFQANKFADGQRVRGEYEEEPSYLVSSLRESFTSIEAAVIAWIARDRLGSNQISLVAGICRALDIA